MSGFEPQRDAARPDEDARSSSSPPPLVFKPDIRQVVQVARVRAFILVAAAILMLVALFLILSYRPPVVIQPDQSVPAGAAPLSESVSPVAAPVTGQTVAIPVRASGVEIARAAAVAIDTLVSAAAEKWLRAAEFLPQGTVTSDNAREAAERLREAVILADSARQDILHARQRAESVRKASREVESSSAFRLSVLYSAMDRYLKSMGEDAADRRAYYAKSVASVEAMLLADLAESETQQNVAISYLRHSEDRQAGLKRLAAQMREAQRNIDNAGR